MAPKPEISVDSLISAFSNDKVIESLSKVLQPLIQCAVDNAIEKLTHELKQRDVIIANLQKDNSELKAKLNSQSQYIEQIETYSKQENLIIQGLPSNMAESVSAAQQSSGDDVHVAHESSATTESTFLKFCTDRLGINVKPMDISICHRLKKADNMQHPPIIVRFTNRKARQAVLDSRRMLRSSGGGSRVFINEHLTRNANKMHATARKLVREGKLQQVWIHHGRVVVKSLDGRTKALSALSELDNL